MKKELVSILSDLVALPSPYPPGTSVEICAYAAKRLRKAGYRVEIATKTKGVDNVIARRGGPARGELIFTFVADEENLGPDGMEFLRKSGRVRPDALILGAQTENNLIVAERGVMWAKITTRGKAAHAGNPSAGDNAILRMMRLVGAQQAHYDKALARR